jgi:hypothetical protein
MGMSAGSIPGSCWAIWQGHGFRLMQAHNKWFARREYNHLFTPQLLTYAAISLGIRWQPTGLSRASHVHCIFVAVVWHNPARHRKCVNFTKNGPA